MPALCQFNKVYLSVATWTWKISSYKYKTHSVQVKNFTCQKNLSISEGMDPRSGCMSCAMWSWSAAPDGHWIALNSLWVNYLSNDEFLNWFKLKAFADGKINITEKLEFVLGRVENMTEKGENAGCQHFLLFTSCFQKTSSSGSLKVGIMCKVLTELFNNLRK